MIAATTLSHIVMDERGVPWIDGKNVKVIEVVLDHLAYGWSADTIQEQQPHLTLAEIHSSLAFYYDHSAEFDVQIARQKTDLENIRAQTGESPLQARLRSTPKQR